MTTTILIAIAAFLAITLVLVAYTRLLLKPSSTPM